MELSHDEDKTLREQLSEAWVKHKMDSPPMKYSQAHIDYRLNQLRNALKHGWVVTHSEVYFLLKLYTDLVNKADGLEDKIDDLKDSLGRSSMGDNW